MKKSKPQLNFPVEPIKPKAPTKPSKSTSIFRELFKTKMETSMSEILSKIPKKINQSDVVIHSSVENGYDGEVAMIIVGFYEIIPNKNFDWQSRRYDEDLIRYNNLLKNYKTAKSRYEKDLEKYEELAKLRDNARSN